MMESLLMELSLTMMGARSDTLLIKLFLKSFFNLSLKNDDPLTVSLKPSFSTESTTKLLFKLISCRKIYILK